MIFVSIFYFCSYHCPHNSKNHHQGAGVYQRWMFEPAGFGFPLGEFPYRAITVPITQIKKLRQSEVNRLLSIICVAEVGLEHWFW